MTSGMHHHCHQLDHICFIWYKKKDCIFCSDNCNIIYYLPAFSFQIKNALTFFYCNVFLHVSVLLFTVFYFAFDACIFTIYYYYYDAIYLSIGL